MSIISERNGWLVLAHKTRDETVNTSDTLQLDNELLFHLGAGEKRRFKLVLYVTTDTTADFKFAFVGPTGIAGFFSGTSIDLSVATPAETAGREFGSGTITTTITDSGAQASNMYVIEGVVKAGAKDGTFGLQWAQNTSNASDTIVKAGSYLEAERLPT